MQQAYERARKSFRYFWRELAWEYRRIVPALDLACVKAPFSDGDWAGDDDPVEQMWVNEIEFDGKTISGILINQPNELFSVAQGDAVELTIPRMTDWMYAIGGRVYGAFTVNVMRSRMGRRERAEHDEAWGSTSGTQRSCLCCLKNTRHAKTCRLTIRWDSTWPSHSLSNSVRIPAASTLPTTRVHIAASDDSRGKHELR